MSARELLEEAKTIIFNGCKTHEYLAEFIRKVDEELVKPEPGQSARIANLEKQVTAMHLHIDADAARIAELEKELAELKASIDKGVRVYAVRVNSKRTVAESDVNINLFNATLLIDEQGGEL